MSVYRRPDELLVALIIPADGGEPRRVGCSNLNELLPGDKFMVASRQRIPDSIGRPWDQPEGLQPAVRPATWDPRHRDDSLQWQYEVAMGSAGQPRQTRRKLVRGYTPANLQTPEWLSLPTHARYPDIRGDVYVSCYATNRLTGESIQLSVTADDVPDLMDTVGRAYLGYYSAFVHDFGARIERLPTDYPGMGGVPLRRAVIDEQTRLTELGHLVEFRPDVWHRTFYVPVTPADAQVAIEAITKVVSDMSDAASAARARAADELLAEEERAREPAARDQPSRANRKKQRMRAARAAKTAGKATPEPASALAAPAALAAPVSAPEPAPEPAPKPALVLPKHAPPAPAPAALGQSKWLDPEACTICSDGPRNTVFLPCAHVCCCVACGQLFTTCPYCAAEISACVRLYVV